MRHIAKILTFGFLLLTSMSDAMESFEERESFISKKDTIPELEAVNNTETVPILPGEEIEVIKDFDARLANTSRIKNLLELPVFVHTEIEYIYGVDIRSLKLDYLPPTIKPVALIKEPMPKYYHSLIKLGYGFPRFSVAEINSAYRLTDKISVGISYAHMAAKHKDRKPSRFNEHVGHGFVKMDFSDHLSIVGGVLVDIDGHDLMHKVSFFNAKRNTSSYGGYFDLFKNISSENTFGFSGHLGANHTRISDLPTNETIFNTNLSTSKKFDEFGAHVGFDINRMSYSKDTSSALISIGVLPKISYNSELWNVTAGLQVLLERKQAYFLPKINVTRSVLGTRVLVSLFAEGDVEENSWKRLLAENPYINNQSALASKREIKFGVGASGTGMKFDYNLAGGYKIIKNVIGYHRAENTSGLVLWDAVAHHATSPFVEGKGSYKISNSLSVGLDLLYQNIRDTSGIDVSGLYDMEFGSSVKFILLDSKLSLEPKIVFIGNIDRNTDVGHNSLVDLGFSGQYSISDQVNIFIDAFNILNSRKERWAQYKALGINVQGGVIFKF